MAKVHWRGTAPATAGVMTATPGSINSGDTFTISFVGGRSFTVTASGTSAAQVCLELVEKLQTSADPLVSELTFAALPSGAETYVQITGPDDGKPFDFTLSSVGGTFTKATVTAATGPNWWTNPDNWSSAAVPTNTDEIICETDVPILYGLSASEVGITESSATLTVGGEQEIGLPEQDDAGYSNLGYRATYLEAALTAVTVRTSGKRCKIDTLGAACTTRVFATGSGSADEPGCIIKGNDAANVVDIAGGSVGVHIQKDSSPTGTSESVISVMRVTGPASVTIGALVTTGTLEQAAGVVTTDASITTVAKAGGELTVRGTAAVTTLNNDGGTVRYNSSGTIGTYRGGNRQIVEAIEESVLDLSGDHRPVTITNCVLGPERARIHDPGRRRTHTNAATIGMGTVAGIAVGRTG